MAQLLFSPEAAESLTRIENDANQRRCAGRLNTALDLLEVDPGDSRNRRRRFNTIGLWGITVHCEDEDWLILWEPRPDDTAIVHHIIPAP